MAKRTPPAPSKNNLQPGPIHGHGHSTTSSHKHGDGPKTHSHSGRKSK